MSLRDEILALPQELLQSRNDVEIARRLSVGRTKIVKREVGDGAIALAIGMPAGPVFLYKLRRLAETVLPADATDEQIAPVASAQQAVKSLDKTSFDVGDPKVREAIDAFVGVLLEQEHAAAIKDLAVVADPVPVDQVSAILNAEGY